MGFSVPVVILMVSDDYWNERKQNNARELTINVTHGHVHCKERDALQNSRPGYTQKLMPSPFSIFNMAVC